jgi:hypothetical protein
MITIAVVNQSTAAAQSDLAPVVAALRKQVEEDFWPAWGIDAELDLIAHGAAAPATAWQLVILDDSDQAEALGYHETTAAGLPLGKVFARTTMRDGGQWSVTASHELLEMLADPEINLSVFVQNTTYAIDNVLVSNFVLPRYFEPGTAGATPAAPFDFLKQLAMPLPAMLPGGYLSVFQVGGQSQGWQQITDMRARPGRMMPAAGSRRDRRLRPRPQWRRSA